ncbi:MAG: metalloregulator ArsR/SmtB family transcription factor [Desulfomonilaceae bacterium]
MNMLLRHNDGGIPAVNSFIDNQERAEHVAEIVKAFAHPLRLRILAILSKEQDNVTGLANRLGASQPDVSHQLAIMRTHGILACERKGTVVRYGLARPRLKGLIDYLEGCEE